VGAARGYDTRKNKSGSYGQDEQGPRLKGERADAHRSSESAKKWAGRVGVDSGPIPLRRWHRDPIQVATTPVQGKKRGESIVKNDLRSERGYSAKDKKK
jgi:hypothetical protein